MSLRCAAFSEIFRPISPTREKWRYVEDADVVIDLDTRILKQMTSSLEHINSMSRGTVLSKNHHKIRKVTLKMKRELF